MASKSVGSLFVNLVAKTTKFDKGMKGAQSKLKAFGRSVAAVGKKILTFGAILTGVAIGGMVAFVRSQLEVLDKLAKTSDALGLTANALGGLQHAAELTGVSNDQLATALKRMEKTIGDANVGLTTAERSFIDLKLSLKQITALNPEEQFSAIADAMNEITDQSKKARIAQDVFGRSGLMLINTLKLGSQGLAEMSEEWIKLTGGITEKEKKQIEEVNDQLTRLSTLVGGLGRGFVIDVAPGAAEAIQGLVLLIQQWNTLQGKAGEVRDKVRNMFPWTRAILGAASDYSREAINNLFQGINTNQGPTASLGNARFMQPTPAASQSAWQPNAGGASQASWVGVLEDIRDNTAKQEEPAMRMAIP